MIEESEPAIPGAILKSESFHILDRDSLPAGWKTGRFSALQKQRIAEKLRRLPQIAAGLSEADPAVWPLQRLQLEPVNRCNYRCALCRTHRSDWVPRRAILFEEACRLIEPIAEQLTVLTLYGTRGEPLLHPRLEDIVAYTKARTAAKTRISTNGSLVSETRARRLLDAGLDLIIFAVDGLTQQTYAAYRQGGRLQTVVANLRRLCELKHAGGYRTRVVFQFIPMAANEHEVPQVADFAYDLGVDVVKLKYSTSVAHSDTHRTAEDDLGPGQKHGGVFVCPLGLDGMYVDPNGYSYPCCYAEGEPSLVVGNALTESPAAIWDKSEMWALRRSFAEQKGFNDFCLASCRNVPRGQKKILKR
jgi:MoaA/NifB/PqqE/SkfB family radical SAM enzyme